MSRACAILLLFACASSLIGIGAASPAQATALPQTESSGYPIRWWTAENGLPQNWVTGIAQTPDGALWIGTGTALVRFDGLVFDIYDRANTPALPSIDIESLYCDRHGTLWIATAAGVVTYLDGRFQRQSVTPTNSQTLPASVPTATGTTSSVGQRGPAPADARQMTFRRLKRFFEDRDGNLWGSTPEKRLFQRTSRGWLAVRTREQKSEQVDGRAATQLAATHGMALNGLNGLIAVHGDGAVGLRDERDEPIPGRWPVLIDREGVLWSAHGDQLQRHVSMPGSSRLRTLPPIPTPSRPTALYASRDGSLWVGLASGLYRYVEGRGLVPEWRHGPISVMFEDDEGNLWAGTRGQGLIQVRCNARFRVLTSHHGLPSDLVWTVLEDRAGVVWIGTEKGLARWADGRLVTIGEGGPLAGHPVFSLASGPDGDLWIGSHAGVFRFDGTRLAPQEPWMSQAGMTGPWQSLTPRRPASVRGEILLRPGDQAWLGTSAGLFHHGDHPGLVSRATTLHGLGITESNEPYSEIRGLHQDRRQRLWIATGQGLLRREDGVLRQIDVGGEPLSAYDLLEEADGTLWISTRDQGLVRDRAGNLARVTSDQGLPDNTIHRMLDDGLGWYWMGSDRGIFRIRIDALHAVADGLRERLDATVYGIEDGLMSAEINSGFPGATRLQDGRLAFATMKGLALVDPARMPRNSVPPRIALVGLEIDLASAPLATRVVLKPDQRNIAIDYRATTFSTPHATRYHYQLDGYDEDWVDAQSRRRATYTGIPPGHYTFRVRAANADGVWSEEDAVLFFDVPARIRETPAFYALCIGAAGCLLWGAMRWRLTHRNHKTLERLVRERTDRLERRTKSLVAEQRKSEAQARLLKEQAVHLEEVDRRKTRFFTDLSHELRTPLTLLLAPLERLAAREDNPRRADDARLAATARRLTRQVDQMLDLARLEAGHMPLHCREIDLVPFLREQTAQFNAWAATRDQKLTFTTPLCSARAVVDADRLVEILTNLVANAVKFTADGGSICVSLDRSNGGAYRLAVADSGIGISAKDLPFVFDRFRRFDDASSPIGSGLGLALVQELVTRHGGEISVESERGQGTCFTIALQPGTRHLDPADLATPPAPAIRSTGIAAPAEACASPVPVETEKQTEAEKQAGMGTVNVLVVEDDPEMVHYLERLLGPHYQVTTARNGIEGIDAARSGLPDIVLTDIAMPQADGLAVARALRDDPRTDAIPIVALTARGAVEQRVAGLASGLDAYLTKPFHPHELIACLDNLITSRAKLRERLSRTIRLEGSTVTSTSADDALLRTILKTAEAHLHDASFGVFELAERVGMSPRHLRRRLRELTEERPSALIRRLRLAKAKQLLEQGAGNVSEVARAVGMPKPAYFSDVFRKAHGAPPSHYLSSS